MSTEFLAHHDSTVTTCCCPQTVQLRHSSVLLCCWLENNKGIWYLACKSSATTIRRSLLFWNGQTCV